MSMPALLNAIVSRLRASPLSYPAAQCDIQPDGAPNPVSGEIFVAVHPLGARNQDDGAHCLDEVFDVGVTVTIRAGKVPVDSYGPKLVALATTGLLARAEAIRAVLHMDYTTINTANTTIGASENGFVEPLRFRSVSAPQRKGPDWFSSDAPSGMAAAGYAVEMVFGGARRVQVIEEQS